MAGARDENPLLEMKSILAERGGATAYLGGREANNPMIQFRSKTGMGVGGVWPFPI